MGAKIHSIHDFNRVGASSKPTPKPNPHNRVVTLKDYGLIDQRETKWDLKQGRNYFSKTHKKIDGICLKDFQPINSWRLDYEREKWDKKEPKFIVDLSTKRRYFNESTEIVQFKCALLILGSLFIQPFTLITNLAYRILKIFSLSHFWMLHESEAKYSFSLRAKELGFDALRVLATPFGLLALPSCAVFGLISPNDGRKLYATLERALYNGFTLAPCFQPEATSHAFGGDINQKNAF